MNVAKAKFLVVRRHWTQVGEERERKRIIELLEAEIKTVSNPMMVDREYLDGIDTSIALIKGEDK